MKKAILLLFLIVLFASCQEEGCTIPYSENFNPNAEIDDGMCILWRDKFLGVFDVEENCNSGLYGYTMGIVTGNFDERSVIINNFGNFGVNVNGDVDGDDIFIPNQSFIFDGNTRLDIFNGFGQFRGDHIYIEYNFIQNGFAAFCFMQCYF